MPEQVEKCFTFEAESEFVKEWRRIDSLMLVERELLAVAVGRRDNAMVEVKSQAIAAIDHEQSDLILSALRKFFAKKKFDLEQFEGVSTTLNGRLIHVTVNIEEM